MTINQKIIGDVGAGFYRIILLSLCLYLINCGGGSGAGPCSGIFPQGAQIHSPNGVIQLGYQSQITGGGTTLPTRNLTIAANNPPFYPSCGSGRCNASGNTLTAVSQPIPASNGSGGAINVPFNSSQNRAAGQYTSITVGQDATLNFTTQNGEYYSGNFSTGFRSRVIFSPGNYWINGNFSVGQETSLEVTSAGVVRIFVTGNVTFGFQARSTNSSPANLLIYSKGSILLNNEVNLKGYLYSETSSVTMQFRSRVEGGVSAASLINIHQEAVIAYSSTAIANADANGLCSGSPPPNGPDNWLIDVGATSASTCQPHAIVFTVRDSGNNILTGYTGLITLSTSTNFGTWTKTSVASDAQGTLSSGPAESGSATYQFVAADSGSIRLNLSSARAGPLTIGVGAEVSGASAPVTFLDNAFVVEPNDSLADDLIAGRPHSFQARMMRRDPNTGDCGVAAGYNVANVKAWLIRASGDPNGIGPTLVANSSVVLPSTEPVATNFNIGFSGGQAAFTLTAADVGKYALQFSDTSNSFAGQAIAGGSTTLIARPFAFYIFGTGIPGASSASGSVFKKAGENFAVSVRAVAWQSADDANDDGIADGHQDADPSNNANLSNNSALTNFAKEVGTAEQSLLAAALLAPSGGTNPGLSGSTTLSSFTNGTASASNIAFNNVGIIELSAVVFDSDYLGAGATRTNKIVGRSGYVGRFYPNAFSLSNLVLSPACNALVGFSYLGQTFTTQLRLTALTTTGATATNYRSDFVKLANLSTAYGAVDLDAPTTLTSRVVLGDQVYAWSNGVLEAEVDLHIARSVSPDGPFSAARIGLRPVDSDSVALLPAQLNLDTDGNGSSDMANLGDTQLRFGRVRLEDSYGPETSDLPVKFLTEYWNGADWIQNSDDSCTTLALSEINYPQGAINNAANRAVTLGGGTTTGEYAAINATQIAFDEGDAGHYFTAPGAGNTGAFDVEVDLTDYPWLRFDWNNDGSYSDAALPSANFTFGSYRGHDRVLYWLEGGP